MSLCLSGAAGAVALAVSSFTLSWTHSVERVEWWERWEVTTAGLRPIEARVVGTGAGMEIPEGAVRDGDGWLFRPHLPLQRSVLLAASGRTPSGWTLCAAGSCRTLGATEADPIRLWVSPVCAADPR
ncbi:DUF1850 domain-containing protein [Frigidibacter sp. MR17.24]|uniref:DUF1850 domain-containing protein n=1 Tax=Frigidibacter sp. MR17.24 TaxID=3127345 RepID=UPI003012EFB7